MAEADPAAPRVDGFLPADADAVSVTSDAVFVDKDRGDKASIVRRLDPRTGKPMWSRSVGDADLLVAGEERVWIADAARGRVLGLDRAPGRLSPRRTSAPATSMRSRRGPTSRSPSPRTACGWRRRRVCSASTPRRAPGPSSSGRRGRRVVAGPSGLITAAAVPGLTDGLPPPVSCASIRSRARWRPKRRSTIPPTSSRSPPARMRWSCGRVDASPSASIR